MIEAKELRIGNYLKNDGVVVKIHARDAARMVYKFVK